MSVPIFNYFGRIAGNDYVVRNILSSLEKIRISLISVSKKRRNTALPNDPVPPVISSVLSLNTDIIYMVHDYFSPRNTNDPVVLFHMSIYHFILSVRFD